MPPTMKVDGSSAVLREDFFSRCFLFGLFVVTPCFAIHRDEGLPHAEEDSISIERAVGIKTREDEALRRGGVGALRFEGEKGRADAREERDDARLSIFRSLQLVPDAVAMPDEEAVLADVLVLEGEHFAEAGASRRGNEAGDAGALIGPCS